MTMGPKERLKQLEKEQPWVFDLAEEEDIANYLRLNVGVLRRLRGGCIPIIAKGQEKSDSKDHFQCRTTSFFSNPTFADITESILKAIRS
jgi:hypothetical protein